MTKCIGIDKPLVSILLAVYKLNTQRLIEQLISLNKQAYNNIELLICVYFLNFDVRSISDKKVYN